MKMRQQVLYEGLVAGLIGYATVALFFAASNLLGGRSPFYTASLLGDVLFYGGAASTVAVGPGPAIAFNGFHMVLFMAVGVTAAWLASGAERGPQFWYIGTILFVFVLIHLVGAMVWMSAPLQAAIPPWSVVTSTLLAAAALSAYLWWVHPQLHHGQEETVWG